MIRIFEHKDYPSITQLFKHTGFEVPTEDELFSGAGFVAIENNETVGFIWALISGKVAVIDYLVVREDQRAKNSYGRSIVGIGLAVEIFKELVDRGVTKFSAVMSNNKSGTGMLRFYRDGLGMKERTVLTVVNGSPSVIFSNLKKLEATNG